MSEINKGAKASKAVQELPKYVKAVSGRFITVDGVTIRTEFKYKDLERFELIWDSDNSARLTYWDNDGKHIQPIKLTKTDFNKYVKPVVKVFEAFDGKLTRQEFNHRMQEINDRITIARLNDDLDLLGNLLIQRKNIIGYSPVEYCKGCAKSLDECTCQF